jgi:hypothetical protein
MRIRFALPLPVLALAALMATFSVAGTAASPVQAKPAIGLADQTVETLKDPRFQKSGIKRLRIAVSYDQIRKGGRLLARQDEYFRLTKAAHKDVIVSFYRTSSCSPKCAAKRLPTVSEFRSDFRRFRKRYPQVKKFSTWNEMNYPLAQPTGRNPKRTAQFYKMLRKECRGGKCSVLTGDFRANGSNFDKKWLKPFLKEIGKGPHQWGLIPYLDTNKFSTKLTKKFLKDTKKGNVYVTENGPIDVFPFGGFRTNPTRQNKAMRYSLVTYPKVSKRIKGQYVYSWQRPADAPKNAFDSALIDGKGKPRPAYFTFFKYLGKKAPQ